MSAEVVSVSGVLADTNTVGDSTHHVSHLHGAVFNSTADATILLKDGSSSGKILARIIIADGGVAAVTEGDFLPHFKVPVGSGIIYVDAGSATVAGVVYYS